MKVPNGNFKFLVNLFVTVPPVVNTTTTILERGSAVVLSSFEDLKREPFEPFETFERFEWLELFNTRKVPRQTVEF